MRRLNPETPGTAVAPWRGGSARSVCPGFTLMEVLVVIATIGVLAGLMFPALGLAQRRAVRMRCMNNLRQFALADTLYFHDHARLPSPSDLVPGSIPLERLALMGRALGLPLPEGPATAWPKRAAQPAWINCPLATRSGYAEGITFGGGFYTGYSYFGGMENSRMVAMGFATIVLPAVAADERNTHRGILWTDLLAEFHSDDPRRFEFFHVRNRVTYPDFRFHAAELDGFHRAWSDTSVEWVPGHRIRLNGRTSPDLRIHHLLGNFYF